MGWLVRRLPGWLQNTSVTRWALYNGAQARAEVSVRCFKFVGRSALDVPELTQMINDPQRGVNSYLAARALIYVGREALPPLTAYLTNNSMPVLNRLLVYDEMCSSLVLRGDEPQAIDVLTNWLSSPDNMLSSQAASVLTRIAMAERTTVPSLVDGLQDPRAYVRRACAMTLGQLGQKASLAVPALMEAANDKDPGVATEASTAVRRILTPWETVPGDR
jgi:hypothetical protein